MPHMLRKLVALGQSDLAQIRENKVSALGHRVGECELIQHRGEAGDLGTHLGGAGAPEVVGGGLLEADGDGLLQRGGGRVADAGVGGGDGVDEVGGRDQVADAPAGAVEVLARAADGEGDGGQGGGEAGDAGEGDVVEAVVDFVGDDEDGVGEAEGADAFEFGFREDFADGVVGRVEDEHFGGGGDGRGEFAEVDGPVGGGGGAGGAIWGWVQGHVFDGGAG